MKKIIGYVRVSTEEQNNKGHSIDEQISSIYQYSKLYYPNSDVRIINDGGFSGKDLNRDGIQYVLKNINFYDVFITYKIDRMSRNVQDVLFLIELFKMKQIDFISIQERIDMSTAVGTAFMQLISVFAELERNQISERTRFGLLSKARKGEWYTSIVPIGYVKNEDNKLIPDENYKNIINKIYKLYYIDNLSIITVAKKLSGSNLEMIKKVEHIAHRVLKRRDLYAGIVNYQDEVFTDIIVEPVLAESLLEKIKGREVQLNRKHDHYDSDVYCLECGILMYNDSANSKGKLYLYKTCKKCRIRFNQKILYDKKFDLKSYEALFYDYMKKQIVVKRKQLYYNNFK
ncbi:MAG: recombinase family protein [Bacilli bacterium]